MNAKITSILSTAAVAVSLSFGAQAQTSFAECNATETVNFDGTIVDAAIATPALSTLVEAVTAAGLGDALATTENITVFAPTNDAFAALPAPLLDAVLADTDFLTAVLTYHVTNGMQDPRKFPGAVATRRQTLQGQSVYFSRSGGESLVNNASLECQGVKTNNGMVWVINNVLLPAI